MTQAKSIIAKSDSEFIAIRITNVTIKNDMIGKERITTIKKEIDISSIIKSETKLCLIIMLVLMIAYYFKKIDRLITHGKNIFKSLYNKNETKK